MGGSQSGEVSNNYLKEFSHHYKFVKEQNDPRFGLIKVFKNKDSEEEVMIVRRMYTSEEEYEYFQRELNLRLGFQHKNLLHLLGYQKESNANLCGHSRVFELYSEYHSHNLKKEIQKRTASLDYFSEAELWYLAESCISIGCFLQQQKIYHGDYRPINIMLSDDGYVKLPDNGILTAIKNNYFKTLSGECRGYLSPELLRFFSKRDPNPKYNVYKADVFSLAITLLYASTLRRPNTVCYDWSQYMLNNRSIIDLLKGVEARYSMAWRELLENMLSLERAEDGRPDFQALFPLKVAPRIEQPKQLQPVVRFQEPLPPSPNKGAELHLIKTQNFEENHYESNNYTNYQQYQQPEPVVPQNYASVQSYQSQPQIYTSQAYQQPPSQQYYEQQSSYIQQPAVQQSPSRYILQNSQYTGEIQQNLYGSNYQPQPIIHQSYVNPQPQPIMQPIQQQSYVNPQPVLQQSYVNQPQAQYVLPQVQNYSAQAYGVQNQGQVYASQPKLIVNPNQYQGNLVTTQNLGEIYEGNANVQRGEAIKRAVIPMGLQTVREERFEDNDLDRRVREALKATQDTIDRNTRMQYEAQKYQYGNNA